MSVLVEFDNCQLRCRGVKAAAVVVLQQNALEVVGMCDQGRCTEEVLVRPEFVQPKLAVVELDDIAVRNRRRVHADLMRMKKVLQAMVAVEEVRLGHSSYTLPDTHLRRIGLVSWVALVVATERGVAAEARLAPTAEQLTSEQTVLHALYWRY